MANPHRGEIEAMLDGKSHRLCLTLGALAELEQAFGEDDMLAIAERFQAGRIRANDAVRVIGAGLRGAGYEITDADVAAMQVESGAAGFVDIVARLLAATFAQAISEPEEPRPLEREPRVACPPPRRSSLQGEGVASPFHGAGRWRRGWGYCGLRLAIFGR
ncbi:gene transfer agent family protein [Methyloligella sp. GL2]|nr:gene transfer agent family protein [Methyloligella sp. GL2]